MLRRNKENPLIETEMVRPSRTGYRVRGAFNPGAILFNEETILLLRVAEDCEPKHGYAVVPCYRFEKGKGFPEILEFDLSDPEVKLKDTRGVVYKGQDYLSTLSHIRLARSRDGVHFTVDDKPFIFPCDESECFGVEDARAVKIGDTFCINYTVISSDGYATALAFTKDFVNLERKGIIFPPLTKDACIFPEKIGGKFCALHRPINSGFGKPSIWYAESPDLLHWGNHKCLSRPRDTIFEEQKIGGGSAPIKTSEGWLEIYHGKGRDQVYSLFLLLLDLNEPSVVLKRGEKPILVPEEDYETGGFFPNVVFSNGICEKENGTLYIYYGACDQTVCLAEATIDELLETLK